MTTIKLCIGCKHFYISFGTADHSNQTPGDPPDISCLEVNFDALVGYDECTEKAFHKAIRTAENCDDFKPRVKEST